MKPRTLATRSSGAARVRPLLVRRGATFSCRGDGLCCTDAHVLGPVSPREARAIGLVPAQALVYHSAIRAHALRTAQGRCHWLGGADGNAGAPDWGCALHDAERRFAKPDGCRRFPFGLVATPQGGRVTTAHRCPCRTMGRAAALDVSEAERSLVDRGGRLFADLRVGHRVRIDARRTVDFAIYCELEQSVLAGIAAESNPLNAIGGPPLSPLRDLQWTDVAHLLRSRIDGTACGDALAWAGDTLLALCGEKRRAPRQRPWKAAFDRAQARCPTAGSARDVLVDWLSDEIWSLGWIDRSGFSVARAELATRAAMAIDMAGCLTAAGARADRAMAEAVLVAELTGESPIWRGVVAAMCDPRLTQ